MNMENFKEEVLVKNMSLQEMQSVDGGKASAWGAVLEYIDEHWTDIKKGVSDAWNGI